ncbi:hypothetical protein [Methanosarcina barkeri]|nr:hypothetical protein [Methanosarcina barkeri]
MSDDGSIELSTASSSSSRPLAGTLRLIAGYDIGYDTGSRFDKIFITR